MEDAITSFDPGTGETNGLEFKPHEPDASLTAIREAGGRSEALKTRKTIVKNGMKPDYSWNRSAPVYPDLYESRLQG